MQHLNFKGTFKENFFIFKVESLKFECCNQGPDLRGEWGHVPPTTFLKGGGHNTNCHHNFLENCHLINDFY